MDKTCFYLVQFTLMDLKSDNCAQEKPANGHKKSKKKKIKFPLFLHFLISFLLSSLFFLLSKEENFMFF